MKWLLIPLLLVAFLPLGASPAQTASAAPLCFGNVPGITNCIDGRFRAYWEQNGGLPVFGYPIAAAQDAQTPAGPFLAQLFERNRFELHPANPAPYDVLLGRLGADQMTSPSGAGPAPGREGGPLAGCLWFAQTGHNVCDRAPGAGFQTYWTTHGLRDPALSPYQQSVALLGYPLSAAHMERAADGSQVLTQWFERARFEWHPDKPVAFRVLLGLLGDESKTGPPIAPGPGTPPPAASPTPGAQPTAVAWPPVSTGIAGTVTIGPTCPGPQRPDQSCEAPYQATINILAVADRAQVASTRSDAQGHFQITLAPGSYVLAPVSAAVYPRAGEQTVTVVAGQVTQVQIQYDSGIR